MLGKQTSWEKNLLSMALEGLEGYHHAELVEADKDLLYQAYRHCEQITKIHSRTFYLASALLPAPKRQAVRALYAFCRLSDDQVDRANNDPRLALLAWRQEALAIHPPQDNPVALAWADTMARYRIPRRYAEQLIEGVGRDLDQNRYRNFEELSSYCYGVASTVGLMAMHIIGFSGPEAIPYALKLGVALQLTNILRDVAEDWRAGRIYLPMEELDRFGLAEQDIHEGRTDARWKEFLRFQIERNRRLYAEAMPGIAMLNPDGRLAIAAAAELYRAILDDIELHEGDVFTRRAHLGAWDKLRRLPRIWLRQFRSSPISRVS